mgnify:CR=1 FL=1
MNNPDDKWKDKPCKEWTRSKFHNGYGQDKSTYRKDKEQYAHRVEWIKHHGPIPKGLKILHHCDNPPCHEITHLFLGTGQDNVDDMIAKQRHMHGERHVHAKLTDELVITLRRLRPYPTLRALSEYFGVSKTTIHNATKGKTWVHVADRKNPEE